jgi:hypothetical protein
MVERDPFDLEGLRINPADPTLVGGGSAFIHVCALARRVPLVSIAGPGGGSAFIHVCALARRVPLVSIAKHHSNGKVATSAGWKRGSTGSLIGCGSIG